MTGLSHIAMYSVLVARLRVSGYSASTIAVISFNVNKDTE